MSEAKGMGIKMKDIKRFFRGNQLVNIPKKEKDKVLLFDYLITFFDKEIIYTEKEINNILSEFYSDYAILRRYLVDFGYLSRENDGSSYTVIERKGIKNEY